LALFEHADSHRELFSAHMRDGSAALVLNANRQNLALLIKRELQEISATDDQLGGIPREVMIRFLTDGLFAVLNWWMQTKPPISVAEGNRIFRQFIERFIAPDAFAHPKGRDG